MATGYGEVTAAVADLCAHGERCVEIARCLTMALADEYALRAAAFEPDERFAVGIPSHIAQAFGLSQLDGIELATP
jgi:hypothetical protein